MSHCLTCYSELPPRMSQQVYLTPCCSGPICSGCLARNPRLREYDPCLRCGDVRTERGSDRIARGRDNVRRRDEEAERGQFAIGDDEDEDDDLGRPPSYHENSDCQGADGPPVAVTANRGESGEATGGEISPAAEADIEMRTVEVKHPVGRGDTVRSIARKYAADPHDLLTLNSLPPTALSSNPGILQTRRHLIISRRLVPRSSLPSPILFDFSPLDTLDPDPEETKRREAERRVKRFQLITKTTDPGVGRAYLALTEMEERRDVLEFGSGEAMDGKAGGGKKKFAEEEGRALEAFFEDEEWEREVDRPDRVKIDGRWTVVGSGLGKIKG